MGNNHSPHVPKRIGAKIAGKFMEETGYQNNL